MDHSKKWILHLSVTGLDKYFNNENTFSAYDIGSWKPHPGLFLHTVEKMQSLPNRSLIIEDTVSGFKAAEAAEIDYFIFSNGEKQSYKGKSLACFSNFLELNDLLY